MNEDELRAAVLKALHGVAPEADLATLDPKADVREELDIDSVGILEFATGIQKETGIDVPERDYPHLVRLDDCIGYLAGVLKAGHTQMLEAKSNES
ncbi:MAG: acyl carrier protein [Thermoanaerobaculales bacterium]